MAVARPRRALLALGVVAASAAAFLWLSGREHALPGQAVSTKCAPRSLNFNDASQNVTTQYQAQGVTFASGRPSSPVLQWVGDLQSVASPSNKAGPANSLAVTYFRQGAGGTASPPPTMTITFSPPVEGATLSFYARTMNDVVAPGFNTLTVQSFSAANALIETRTLQTDAQYQNPRTHPNKTYDQLIAEQRVAFSQGQVAKVVLSDAFTTGVAIDDLTFTRAACNDAACNGDSIPDTLVAGKALSAQLNVQNIGTTTWTGGNYYLAYATTNTTPLSAWGLTNGAAVWSGWPTATIAPLAAPYIPLIGTAPATPGAYTYRWQMVQNGVEAFGPVCGKSITVRAPVDNASCTATVPATVSAGQTFPVTFVMTNNGDTTWSPPNRYLLDTDTASPDWGVNTAQLPAAVPPEASHTFTFDVTAPQTPGTYPLKWSMALADVGGFGQTCGADVTVTPPPAPDVTVSATAMPATVTHGREVQLTVTVQNLGTLVAPRTQLMTAGNAQWAFPRGVTGPQGFACTLSSQDCFIENLEAGESRAYTVTVGTWAEPCPPGNAVPLQFTVLPLNYLDSNTTNNITQGTVYTTFQCATSSASSAASSRVSSSSSSSSFSSAHSSSLSAVTSASSVASAVSSSSELRYCCNAVTGYCNQGVGCTQTFDQCVAACDISSASSSRRSSAASSLVASSRSMIIDPPVSSIAKYCCSPVTGYCTQGPGCTQSYDQCITTCVASSAAAPSSVRRSSSSQRPSSVIAVWQVSVMSLGSSVVSSSKAAVPPPSSASSRVASSRAASSLLPSVPPPSPTSAMQAQSSVLCDAFACARAGNTVCAFTNARCEETVQPPCFRCVGLVPQVSSVAISSFGPSLVITLPTQSSRASSVASLPEKPAAPVAFCGDGRIQNGEQCDDGARNSNLPGARCRMTCMLARCGDGIVDMPQGEQCDDGNREAGDGCNEQCKTERPAPTTLAAQVFELTQAPRLQQPSAPVAPVRFAQADTAQVQAWQILPQATVPVTAASGPGSLAIMAAGAAMGVGYMRRKRK